MKILLKSKIINLLLNYYILCIYKSSHLKIKFLLKIKNNLTNINMI